MLTNSLNYFHRMKPRLRRVTRQFLCRHCAHGDWCLQNDEVTICMRVQSDRPHKFHDGNVGWIHSLGAGEPVPTMVPSVERQPMVDVRALLSKWAKEIHGRNMAAFSATLGVKLESLHALGCCPAEWAHSWCWPMFDRNGRHCGIRVRAEDGHKWAVRGSRQGIFIPKTRPQSMAVICEGPTDTAAALTLGYFALGKPNCSGGLEEINSALERFGCRQALIVSDLDDVGLRGAVEMQKRLLVPSAIMLPPAKDLRQFLTAGGMRETMDSIIDNLIWKQPN